MALGRKTGGRQRGTPNRATAEARVLAKALGDLPLDYMLKVMRSKKADQRRRDAMAIAAAPYLHQKQVSKFTNDGASVLLTQTASAEESGIRVEFVRPTRHAGDD